MYSSIKMYHYFWREGDKVVVQNAVMGQMGQQHTHTPEGFERWKKDNKIDPECLINLDEEDENDRV